MPDAGWSSPRMLLVGAAGLVASCAAVGITAARGGATTHLTLAVANSALLTNDIARATQPSRSQPAAPHAAPREAAPQAAAPPSRCSSDMVLVESSCIDRFEAHLLQKQADGTLAPFPPRAAKPRT